MPLNLLYDMIAVIDYGAGNLKSITNALEFLRVEYKVTDGVEDIKKADKIIFPGVGAFGDCVKALRNKRLFEALKKEIIVPNSSSKARTIKKPYLGICLGLQVLFESSEESPNIKGLSIFKGKCKKFINKNLKIPQIGWNSIKINKSSLLLKNIKNNSYFYFVHSYYVDSKDKEIILTKTNYGIDFVSAIEKNNIFAVQFHPERSGDIGIKILENFINFK